MDRKDLERAYHLYPQIGDRWEHRIAELESDRAAAWADLRALSVEGSRSSLEKSEHVFHKIERLDRAISFLDRALLHLQDVEDGTHYADTIPFDPI